MKSTREAYGEALAELGAMNPNVVVLDADVSKATRTKLFASAFPDRFINCGCAEANMMDVAAGTALSGMVPFATAMATFASLRAVDQIRNTICYAKLKVNIAATHGGITVGEDGPSHQAIEDIAVMRSLPNMTVIVPADAVQTRQAVLATADYPGPVYLRMGRPAVPVVIPEDMPFEIGKAQTLKQGNDITLIACGIMLAEALEAADELGNRGTSATVLNMHTVKPIDEDVIVHAARTTAGIVTAEEGTVIGGLGSAVLEVLAAHSIRVPVAVVGVRDTFAESGSPRELMSKYGLTAADIVAAAQGIMCREEKP